MSLVTATVHPATTHPQKPALSKCYDEHQHTRQYFLVICLSQYTYATKVYISSCVLRAWKTSAPLPLLTLMSPATLHRSTRARSPHLVTLIIIITKYIVHSTPSVAPKWLYRKLPSPQLQLKLFPPKGSEFKPQFFWRDEAQDTFPFRQLINLPSFNPLIWAMKEREWGSSPGFKQRLSTCSAHFWLQIKRLGSKVRD